MSPRLIVGGFGLTACAIAAVFALFFPIYGPGGTSRLVDLALDLLSRATAPLQLGVVGVEMLANVLVFVPIGVFASMLLPRWMWWVGVLAGGALSIVAELFQAAVLSSRVGSMRDVMLNILGCAIGALATFLVRLAASRRSVAV